MNIALWVLQSLLAFVFFGAGMSKLVKDRRSLSRDPKMAWANDFSDSQVKMIGVAEILGAIGLIVPRTLATLPILTPIAAAALVALMVGAIATHVERKESPVAAVVLGALSTCVALGRVFVR